MEAGPKNHGPVESFIHNGHNIAVTVSQMIERYRHEMCFFILTSNPITELVENSIRGVLEVDQVSDRGQLLYKNSPVATYQVLKSTPNQGTKRVLIAELANDMHLGVNLLLHRFGSADQIFLLDVEALPLEPKVKVPKSILLDNVTYSLPLDISYWKDSQMCECKEHSTLVDEPAEWPINEEARRTKAILKTLIVHHRANRVAYILGNNNTLQSMLCLVSYLVLNHSLSDKPAQILPLGFKVVEEQPLVDLMIPVIIEMLKRLNIVGLTHTAVSSTMIIALSCLGTYWDLKANLAKIEEEFKRLGLTLVSIQILSSSDIQQLEDKAAPSTQTALQKLRQVLWPSQEPSLKPTGSSVFKINQDFTLNMLRGGTLKLWPHQYKALNALMLKRPTNNIALIVMPTGTGKTGVAVLAPYVLGAMRVLVVTPSIIIVKQIADSFNGRKENARTGELEKPSFFEECLLIAPDERREYLASAKLIEDTRKLSEDLSLKNLIITNAQKFAGTRVVLSDFKKDQFDLVIIDEAHHYPARTWLDIVQYFSGLKLFLTATPMRNNKPIVPIESQIFTYEVSDAIKDGIIRKVKFEEVGNQEETRIEVQAEEVTRRIVSILQKHDEQDSETRHQAMIITYQVEEAELCAKKITSLGFSAAAYVSKTPLEVLKRFKSGKIRILIICGRLLEGFDHPPISVVGILRNIHTSSRVLFTQFVGRCLRKVHKDEHIVAHIVSHSQFQQRNNFENLNAWAEVDPEEPDVLGRERLVESKEGELVHSV